jgi:hypothetical protein
MSLIRRCSAPMLNVEATGPSLTKPKSAGSARPPTSASTHSFRPLNLTNSQKYDVGMRYLRIDTMV